jgi:rRNA-processing protein FCF1
MTLVILDTNVLIADYWFGGTGFLTLFGAADQINITIGIPALVVDEVKGNFRKHAATAASEFHSASRKWTRFDLRHEVRTVDVKAISEDYEKYIDSVFP